MTRWFRSLLAWETIFEVGIYAYQQNHVTGARGARRVVSGGWSPIDWAWLTRTEGRTPPRAARIGFEVGDRTIGPFRP